MRVVRPRRGARLAAVVAVALVVGAGIGAAIAIGLSTSRRPGGPSSTSTSTSTSASAAPLAALAVSAVSPANGTTGVSASGVIAVTFSAPVSKSSPDPVLTPATPGTWQASGATLSFTPTTPFPPLTDVTVSVPGGPDGIRAENTAVLAAPVTSEFQVVGGSIARLQQLLSLLDYSPLTWSTAASALAPDDTAAQLAAVYDPPAGHFSWAHPNWPKRLRAMWKPGVDNVFTRGLIMSFEADHSLPTHGQVNAALWEALLSALAENHRNTGGYNWALADKAAPESLTVYHNGQAVVRSPANTGIAGAPTPDGTFAVYTRLRRQVMRGTDPSGQHYADLVQYIAYFHGNDAVHYMDRADYGIPQSLGCVELPLADAARVWPYLAYGTLVTVIG